MTVVIREETPADRAGVRRVNEDAFARAEEADLVDKLRGRVGVVSLVAIEDGSIVGHALFSPVTIESAGGGCVVAGLGPLAVLPTRQAHGIGSALVRAGLEACRRAGYSAMLVLGHPTYYPRFGFVPSTRFGIRWEGEAPEEAFMALELVPGALAGHAGIARYLPEFTGV